MLIINKENLTLLVSEEIYWDLGFNEAKNLKDDFQWQGIKNWRFPTVQELSIIKEYKNNQLKSVSYWGISDIRDRMIQETDKNGVMIVKKQNVNFNLNDFEEIPNKILIDDLEQLNTTKQSKHGVILVKLLSDKDINKRNIILRPKKRNVEKDNIINIAFNTKNHITIKSIEERSKHHKEVHSFTY